MNRMRSLQASFLIAVMLAACATFAPPRTLSQSLVYAQSTATAAMQLATPLVQQGLVKPEQGQAVLDSALLVRHAIDTARTFASRGDAAGAQAQLSAIAGDLQLLEAFVQAHRSSP